MRPLVHTSVFVPDDAPATAPATQTAASEPSTTQTAETAPATSTAPSTQMVATQPATRPGKSIATIVDPNQTSRFIYKADYDNIWRQALDMFTKAGFLQDRLDYRLGVMTTQSLPSAQIVEFWKPQQTGIKNAIENTMHNQQRRARLTIETVPGKPDFYQIAIQVLVERQTNPAEQIGGPIFVEGSGFGRATVALRSDYAAPGKKDEPPIWVLIGHDPDLEKKLLRELFKRI